MLIESVQACIRGLPCDVHECMQLRDAARVNNDVALWVRTDSAPLSFVELVGLTVSPVPFDDDNACHPRIGKACSRTAVLRVVGRTRDKRDCTPLVALAKRVLHEQQPLP